MGKKRNRGFAASVMLALGLWSAVFLMGCGEVTDEEKVVEREEEASSLSLPGRRLRSAETAYLLSRGISLTITASFIRKWGRLRMWKIPGGCRCWKGQEWSCAGMHPIREVR